MLLQPRSKLRVEDLTTANEAMARCLRIAALASKSDVPAVLLGETGTGKTLLAHAIHNSSARTDKPIISFNASSTPRRYCASSSPTNIAGHDAVESVGVAILKMPE